MLMLYYAPGACSMASHIVLEDSGEKYEPKKVDLAGGEQRTEAYLKINPLGRVPVLRLDNGDPLADSLSVPGWPGAAAATAAPAGTGTAPAWPRADRRSRPADTPRGSPTRRSRCFPDHCPRAR